MILSQEILGLYSNYLVWGHGQKKKKGETCCRRSIRKDHEWTFKIEDHIRDSQTLNMDSKNKTKEQKNMKNTTLKI